MNFDIWHLWVALALLALIVEIFTTDFSILCLSIGAIAAAVAAALGAGTTAQLLWFAIFTFLAFITVRPLLIKYFNAAGDKEKTPTNVNALIGRTATVSQDFSNGEGRVAIDGDDWKAVCEQPEATLKQGDKVTITQINSIILTVKQQ